MDNQRVVIDQGTIKELLSLTDDAAAAKTFLQKLIDAFKIVGDTTLPAMRAALTEGNQLNLSRLGHRLKGTSRTIGAVNLGDLCESLEQGAKSAKSADVTSLVDAIEHGYREALRALEKF